mgnify:CR=1 FL=1
MVRITLKHGDELCSGLGRVPSPEIIEEVKILPGQSVCQQIGYLEIREGGTVVGTIDPQGRVYC